MHFESKYFSKILTGSKFWFGTLCRMVLMFHPTHFHLGKKYILEHVLKREIFAKGKSIKSVFGPKHKYSNQNQFIIVVDKVKCNKSLSNKL